MRRNPALLVIASLGAVLAAAMMGRALVATVPASPSPIEPVQLPLEAAATTTTTSTSTTTSTTTTTTVPATTDNPANGAGRHGGCRADPGLDTGRPVHRAGDDAGRDDVIGGSF